MAKKSLIPTILTIILIISLPMVYISYFKESHRETNAYVGIAFCGNTVAEAKLLIDKVRNYTNLFVLDSGRNSISRNNSAVIEICDYATANGLSIIINLGINSYDENDSATWFWHQSLEDIRQNWTERWGKKFLGIYYNDEPGGIQLDGKWAEWYREYGENLTKVNHAAANSLYKIYQKMLSFVYNGTMPQDYNLEAKFFIQNVIKEDPGLTALKNASITTFTSDYALYWFDYLGGYDVLFAEIGWNSSISQQIALAKGAARLQEKEWGAIITWKYNSKPYLDSGDQMYNQMISAYQAGAKYIIVFNYPVLTDNPYGGTMEEEHFFALEKLWNDITQKRIVDLSMPIAALVLPNNYGWGLRNPDDSIWGFWPTDEKSNQIGIIMSKLLAKFGVSLDVVYEDPAYPVAKGNYQNIYYWNSTTI